MEFHIILLFIGPYFSVSRLTCSVIISLVLSRSLVFEDNEHGLFTVTLFKKVVDEFKLHARDKK